MRLDRFAACIAATLVSVLPATSAVAASDTPIGAAVRVVETVTASLDQDLRTLVTNDDVRQNELIAVSDNGLGELVLADETKLALGPGAKLVLDKFVYDPDKTGGAIALNLTRGAFRFITGLAKKPSYVIRTPNASITVRGTIFDVYVGGNGAVWMLLHEGAIRVCNDRGDCQVLDDPCRAVRVDDGGNVGEPGSWNGLRQNDDVEFDEAFPFVVSPPELDPEPRFERASVEAGRCEDGGSIAPPKPRRAEPTYNKPAPKYQAPKKVKYAREEPPAPKKKYEAPKKYETPKKPKVAKYNKRDYDDDDDDRGRKKYKSKGNSGAKAAAALGLAVGIGLAIGSRGGGRKGGYGGY